MTTFAHNFSEHLTGINIYLSKKDIGKPLAKIKEIMTTESMTLT